jgi:hypothetical protein
MNYCAANKKSSLKSEENMEYHVKRFIYNIDSFYEISCHHTSIERKGLHLIPQIFTKP